MSIDPRPRYNRQGHILCFNCERYLPGDQFVWRTSPSLDRPRWSSYCRPCQRELDRLRWRGERRERNNASRLVRQAKQQARERRDKADFMASGILLLRRRGLTKSEIARLMDVSMTSVLDWEKRKRRVTDAATRRLGVVIRETAYLPAGEQPVYRRRLPHPDIDRLMARCRPQIARYPVRDRWKPRRERAA